MKKSDMITCFQEQWHKFEGEDLSTAEVSAIIDILESCGMLPPEIHEDHRFINTWERETCS